MGKGLGAVDTKSAPGLLILSDLNKMETCLCLYLRVVNVHETVACGLVSQG